MKTSLNYSTKLFLLFCCISLSGMKCKKDELGLPPITQTGANKLGFLLNGQPWTPKGHVGMSANLSLSVDFGYNDGVFSITAYRYDSETKIKDTFGIGMRDSLNHYITPFSIPVSNTGLPRFYASNKSCKLFSYDSDTHTAGKLTITKLDKINKIIAGTFDVTLSKPGCDTIKITDGRFDMKF